MVLYLGKNGVDGEKGDKLILGSTDIVEEMGGARGLLELGYKDKNRFLSLYRYHIWCNTFSNNKKYLDILTKNIYKM